MNKSNVFKLLTEEIKAIVSKHFNTNNFEFSLLTGGLFNTTYLLIINQQDKYVLRVGPVNRQLLLPFENNLMNSEKYFCELCYNNGIPVAKIITCETEKNLIDRDYMIVEYIESVPLSSNDLTQHDKMKLYEETGQYVSKINSIVGNQFGRVSYILQGKGFSKWSEYLQFEIEEWAKTVFDYKIFTPSELVLIKKVFVKYAKVLDEITCPHLVHADIWEGNILVSLNDGKYFVSAIIDGDRCIWGDADFELASEWMINEWFIKGYGKTSVVNDNITIRRKLYMLIYNLIDSYVCLVEYNNEQNSANNKNSALTILTEFS